MTGKSKARLLAAAERIVIEHGVGYLTVRRVGDLAGLNSALITYHFGGVAGLLETLCDHNLMPMREAWKALDEPLPDDDAALPVLLRRWLEPLLLPGAFTPGGRALAVIDEIASRESGELSERLTHEMAAIARNVMRLAQPHLPHLSPEELMARLRFIAGAALGPPPRTRLNREGIFANTGEEGTNQLVRFAYAALSGPGDGE
ncbi:TetR/AcrR family transcriptional regulator [Altericroceibacterium spongiae]|uniref:TetR/AcrR family transcriptional regulator n=1 Tax=Altericroceibacterium spongiae TaxID=2320269 RepID=A0A420EF35_9SPHN|nr:TetR/AcrR family transcriptional regulator [Altericroceibacterium spongiae]RKF19280.1 TetR/AcrR family transcriptional regulator [Altericroceibacterium spongiae]